MWRFVNSAKRPVKDEIIVQIEPQMSGLNYRELFTENQEKYKDFIDIPKVEILK